MGIKDYSTTPANNNSAPPNGFPENQLPSTVNNSARQVMADIRSWYEDAEWRDFGHTVTYVSGTSFTIDTDVTSTYVANRRIRAVGSSTGTIYGTIDSSSYSAPDTTVTVTWDSGSLVSETLAVSLGVTPTNDPIPVESLKGELPIANGGTGASTASGARTNLGISDAATELDSGTYTPTLTGSTNVDSASTNGDMLYQKVGSVVTVYGKASVNATSADSDTVFFISLPEASNFTLASDLAGVAVQDVGSFSAYRSGIVFADTSGDRARVEYYVDNVNDRNVHVSFMYIIK